MTELQELFRVQGVAEAERRLRELSISIKKAGSLWLLKYNQVANLILLIILIAILDLLAFLGGWRSLDAFQRQRSLPLRCSLRLNISF